MQGDQPANANEAVRLGIGTSIPFQKISEKELFDLIQATINDPKYTNRAKELGALAVDQIEHPLQRATWWLEHIMRHPKEYIKKSPVHRLAWYQYFCLDVMLTVVALLSLTLYIAYRIFKLCCSSRKEKDKRE